MVSRKRPRRLSARDARAALVQKEAQRARWLRGPLTRAAHVRDAVGRAGTQVHAIGIGRKIVGGVTTQTACVRFYVVHKLPRELLSHEDIIAKDLDGVPTDVIEAPVAYFAAPLPPACSVGKLRRQRPICPGISAANASILGGTLGAVCRSTLAGEENGRYVLSNSHIFVDPSGGVGQTSILQPSPRDGGTDQDVIAQLARSQPIIEGSQASNTIDAAVALLSEDVEADLTVCRVGSVVGTEDPLHGALVHKHGRSTGYSTGLIDDPSCDVLVPRSEAANAPVARFVNQMRIVPTSDMSIFAQEGDSGSLIVNRRSQKAVGLLFACPLNGSFAYANPINAVLSSLNVRLEM